VKTLPFLLTALALGSCLFAQDAAVPKSDAAPAAASKTNAAAVPVAPQKSDAAAPKSVAAPPVAAPKTNAAAPPAAVAKTDAAAKAPEPTPVPSDEAVLSGSVDVGYRWNTGVYGSVNTYRSIVDLGSGLKLLGTEFTILNPSKRFFDRIDVRAYNWGDDPYSTAHIDIFKAKLYRFSGDYRNIAYYSNLPAFADPLLSTTGVVLDEQALDTRKRIGSYRLELLPGRRIVPYLEYEHNSDQGTGVANFVANANEYPVVNLIRNSSENYRGGVQIELSRFHAKIEQGATTFRDDEQLHAGNGTNFGNFFAPVIGATLDLTSLSEAWNIRSHSVYTDASFSTSLRSWADLYGTFLYSEPQSTVNFSAADTGSQILFSQLIFYSGEQNLISAVAKLPHVSASAGAELRPFRRLRAVPSWLTDRMHSEGSAAGAQNLTTASGVVPIATQFTSRLVNNTSQAGMNLFFDLTRTLTIRGGYRYVWGDASDITLPLGGLVGFEQGKIRRNVVIAGLAWHPVQNAWINLDLEDGMSGSSYFRTSLYNYQKARLRGRHQISPSLSVALSASLLKNNNPSPGINYDFFSHQESVSAIYAPSSGKTWDFEGGYTRSTLRSLISYYDPEFLILDQSFYRSNTHTVTALFDLNVPKKLRYKTKFSFGGSAFLSSGSNPGAFYQPTAKLAVTVSKNAAWISEWRYYGFNEAFYAFQGFRTQMVTTGVRISK
jgi:hypothetical protein